jgi:hypothetical protein
VSWFALLVWIIPLKTIFSARPNETGFLPAAFATSLMIIQIGATNVKDFDNEVQPQKQQRASADTRCCFIWPSGCNSHFMRAYAPASRQSAVADVQYHFAAHMALLAKIIGLACFGEREYRADDGADLAGINELRDLLQL